MAKEYITTKASIEDDDDSMSNLDPDLMHLSSLLKLDRPGSQSK